VLLRRGPSKWFRLILWQTAKNVFVPGQWFRGMIYSDKCDLSPDGKLFVYFAAKHHRRESEVGEAWTAVSKPPYLTALALWTNGSFGTYYGGGLFVAVNELYLHGGEKPFIKPSPKLKVTADPEPFFGCSPGFNLWRVRSEQDGWRFVGALSEPRIEKSNKSKRYVLDRAVKIYGTNPFTGIPEYLTPRSATYSVRGPRGQSLILKNVNWADWKGNRLVYTSAGKLFLRPEPPYEK
jgi:hypothetical protein